MSPDGPTIAPPLVDTTHALPAGQYYDERTPKDLVVLHHTVSGNWPGTVRFWASDTAHVGTAYGIDRDPAATVCRAFPDAGWAIHLFRRRRGGESGGHFSAGEALALERRSIGIEIVSRGGLTEKAGGILVDTFGLRLGPAAQLVARGEVTDLGAPWRGYRFFHAYTEAQVVSTIKLVTFLCLRGIPPVVPPAIARAEANPRTWVAFRGVVSHAMLRPDKSDTHPGFPYDRLAYALGSAWA